MTRALNEFRIKYGPWTKALFIFPVAFPVVVGLFFYLIARFSNLVSNEAIEGLDKAAIIMFSVSPFIMIVYWLLLPRKILVLKDKLMLRFGRFHWDIPYETIEQLREAKEVKCPRSHNLITCLKDKIEIVRKKRKNIRLSPAKHNEFLRYAESVMSDWKQIHRG